jgi:gamma-glutamylcyclotransferase (GGCT)/AIG2-like uncharacterized protein YtfP
MGERAHSAMEGCDLLEDNVRVPGFDMYALYGFPGITVNEGNDVGIVGEVYEVPDKTVAYLDYYEGYFPDRKEGSHYVRKTVKVLGNDTDVYVYNRDVHEMQAKIIPSGNWKERT